MQNKNLYINALEAYYGKGFTYIELGDGEELWENRCVNKIINANIDVYMLLKNFYDNDRLYFLWGNHDIVKQSKPYTKEKFYKYFDKTDNQYKEMFKNISMHEALVLKNKNFNGEIFLIHGHQADFFNSKLWMLARFLSRHLWKVMEQLGVQDPTRPAKAKNKKLLVEKKLTEWLMENKCILIAGHTHKAMFSDFDVPPYFNDGCCVRKGEITAIEIENEEITLVKWEERAGENKEKYFTKKILAGPEKIKKCKCY